MKNNLFLKIAALITLAFIGIGVWYFFKANSLNNKVNQDTLSLSESAPQVTLDASYKDTAGIYSLKYPKSWKVQPGSNNSVQGVFPEFTTDSQPINIVPPSAPDNNGVNVQMANEAFSAYQENQWRQNKRTVGIGKVYGRPAKYVNYTVKNDTESYTQHEYIITGKNPSQALYISYRTKYTRTTAPAAKWDESKNYPSFVSIVRSVRFL